MRHSLRSALGALVILAAGTALAQPPAGSEYFPLKQNSKWEYKVGDQTVVVEVKGTEKLDKDDAVRVVTKVGDKEVTNELYVVKADGVYRAKVMAEKVEPPVKILQFPIKKDASWKIASKVGNQEIKGEFKIKDDKEKVKVGGVDYETVHVDGPDFDIANNKSAIRQWFAKDKGLVKIEYVIQGTPAILELQKYTEGK
jgi:hypothetical protein